MTTRDRLPELLTYAEAERILAVKRSTVVRLAKAGDLDLVYVRPRVPRIRADSIDRFMRRNAGPTRIDDGTD